MGLEYDTFRDRLIAAISGYIDIYNKPITIFYVTSYLKNNADQKIWEKQLKRIPERKIALSTLLTVIRLLDNAGETITSENKTQILLALVCYVRAKILIDYEGDGVMGRLIAFITDVNKSELFTNLGMILPSHYKPFKMDNVLQLKEYYSLKDFVDSLKEEEEIFTSDEARVFWDVLISSPYKSRAVTPDDSDDGVIARVASPAVTGLFSERRRSFSCDGEVNPTLDRSDTSSELSV